MPPEWGPGSYGAPAHRVSASRQQPWAQAGSTVGGPPRRQGPYADAPYGQPVRRPSPYDEPPPERLPRRGPRPGGGNGSRRGNGNGNGSYGGGSYGGGRRPPVGDPPQKKVKRRRSWKQRILLGLGLIVVLGCLAGAGTGAWVMYRLGQVSVIKDLQTDAVAKGDPINYLIVGDDSREGEVNSEFGGGGGGGADTTMVVRLDPKAMQASVISFPRDLIIPIAGSNETGRLNSAFAQGPQVLVDTLKQNFGVEINRMVIVDMAGFQRMVDALGGVEMYFDRPLKDDNTGFRVDAPGCITLDGHQGLAYARSRKMQYMQENGKWSRPDPYADLGRVDRQRVFIEVALGKALKQANNPARVLEMVNIGVDTLQVDEDSKDLLALAEQFQGFDLANLATYSLPVIDSGDGATVLLKEDEAEPILNIFRGLDPGDISPGRITVNVYNGTETQDLALNTATALQTLGFKIGERTTTDPHELTTIYHRSGDETVAMRVARHVTGGAQFAIDDDLPAGRVTLVAGANFTTIHEEPTPIEQMPGYVPPAPPPPDPAAGGQTTDTTVPPPVLPPETENHEYTFGGPCP